MPDYKWEIPDKMRGIAMRILHLVAGSVIWLAMTGGVLADVLDGLAKRHRIVREPEYTSSAPKYGLLALGPQATTSIWLVHDGNALYVDRNANGDLTDAGEKVLAAGNYTDPEAGVYQFEVGDIRDGALLHKNLTIGVVRLDHLADRDQQIPDGWLRCQRITDRGTRKRYRFDTGGL